MLKPFSVSPSQIATDEYFSKDSN